MIHLAAALLAAASPLPAHGVACPHVTLTPAVRRAEAGRIRASAHTAVPPAAVEYVLAQGGWRLVWATPPDRERGIYFFRAGRFVDVWGGVLQPGERQEAIRWAMQAPRRVPATLAGCFADAVLAGR